MKKTAALTLGVLLCTLMFANSTPMTGSSVGVMNSGSALIKVFYKAVKSSNVKVSIINADGRTMFSEKINKSDGFMRPYNFKDLPAGEYTIQIADENGVQTEKITYGEPKIEKQVGIIKLNNSDSQYMVSGVSSDTDKLNVNIYDAAGNNIYQETRVVKGQFSKLYNLKEIEGGFSIEVSDASGLLKKVTR